MNCLPFADPLVLLAPNVTVSGNKVSVDWTRSFQLRSPLDGYTLEENFIQTYTGNKLAVTLPTRDVGGKFPMMMIIIIIIITTPSSVLCALDHLGLYIRMSGET